MDAEGPNKPGFPAFLRQSPAARRRNNAAVMFWQSLRVRVALGFGLGVLALVAGLSLVLGEAASRRMLQEQSDTLATLARSTAAAFADGLHERLREVSLLAEQPPVDGTAGWVRIVPKLQQSRAHFSWIGVAATDGRVLVASKDHLVDRNVGERPWFRAALERPHVGDVHAAKLLSSLLPPSPSGEPLRFIDFAAPLRNAQGEVQGVLGVHTDWAWAQDVIDAMRSPLRREQDVRIFVFDRHGEVIHSPRGLALSARPVQLASLPAERATALTWDDGVRYLTAAWRVPARDAAADLGWTVVVRQPMEQALAGAEAQRELALAGGVIAALLTALGAWVLAGRFSRPLVNLSQAARAVEGGALETEIPRLRGAHELQTLGQALRGMTSALVQRERELLLANHSLEDRVAERTADLQRAQAQLQEANAELAGLALRDAMTGLYNRRAGDERLAQEMARHRRHGRPLAVVIADVDHFKAVNDTHGHAAGDAVLCDVARVLLAHSRSSDMVVRHGGEEFVVLMPETGDEGAGIAAEKLRAAVAAHAGRVRVTLSLGVACDAQWYTDPVAALEAADRALYAAKQGGRNRVVFAEAALEAEPA